MRRLKTVRRPPIYPNEPSHLPCSSLTHPAAVLTPSIGVLRWIRGKEWIFGFKYHLLVDAVYGVPIIGFTTTASRNDSPELPRLLDKAETSFGWFKPAAVICDKGYDAQSNYVDVVARGAAPVIAIRKLPNDELRDGIYTDQGVPTCVGMAEMDYIGTRPGQGHLYRCPPQGCRLKARKGVRYCHDTEWVNRPDDPKVFGPIRRASNLWKALYRLRQTVEGVFKTLKESRRLERHCTRGLKAIGLHATMAVLVFQATFALRLARNQMGSCDGWSTPSRSQDTLP